MPPEERQVADYVRHDPICGAWMRTASRPCSCGARSVDAAAAKLGVVTDYEQIVRALAAIEDPSVADRDYGPSSDCGLCRAVDGPGQYGHWLGDPMRHEESCPWRMAKLLIDGGEHG